MRDFSRYSYLMQKLSLLKHSSGTIEPISDGEDKEVYTSPKGISLKVNLIA